MGGRIWARAARLGHKTRSDDDDADVSGWGMLGRFRGGDQARATGAGVELSTGSAAEAHQVDVSPPTKHSCHGRHSNSRTIS
jgi:hypothetical protein